MASGSTVVVGRMLRAGAEDALLTRVDRVDAQAAGAIHLTDADGVDFGRSGLRAGGPDGGGEIGLTLAGGEFGSVSGRIEHAGSGTFRLDSSGSLEVSTAIVSTGAGAIEISTQENLTVSGPLESGSGQIELSTGATLTLAAGLSSQSGDIVIAAGEVVDGTAGEELLLEARNGRIEITAQSGIGSVGAGDLELASAELSLESTGGDLAVELMDTTTVVDRGLRIASGSGQLVVNQTSGLLTLEADLLHLGGGAIDLDSAGSVSLDESSRIATTSGGLELDIQGALTMSAQRRTSTTAGAIDVIVR